MDDDEARSRLLSLQRELTQSLAGTQEQGETVELDQTAVGRLSRVDALQAQAMAQAQERRTTLRLAQVDNALKRVENGRYGECMRCGEDIAEARLAARPEAPFCISCAQN